MPSTLIEYHHDHTLLEAYCALPANVSGSTPAVLVAHDWSGKNKFACDKADELAKLGYIGFALDMFGKGIVGKTKEEKSALITPLVQNRPFLQQRMLKALEALKKVPNVNTSQIGAIGFCFGGLCVLDLARTGADVAGVVSFHGLLNAPDNTANNKIKAQVLALHGYADPMVTPDHVMQFGNEMTHHHVDWQLHMYGNVMHAFMNPEANDPGFGTVYHATTAKRAWRSMKDFFGDLMC